MLSKYLLLAIVGHQALASNDTNTTDDPTVVESSTGTAGTVEDSTPKANVTVDDDKSTATPVSTANVTKSHDIKTSFKMSQTFQATDVDDTQKASFHVNVACIASLRAVIDALSGGAGITGNERFCQTDGKIPPGADACYKRGTVVTSGLTQCGTPTADDKGFVTCAARRQLEEASRRELSTVSSVITDDLTVNLASTAASGAAALKTAVGAVTNAQIVSKHADTVNKIASGASLGLPAAADGNAIATNVQNLVMGGGTFSSNLTSAANAATVTADKQTVTGGATGGAAPAATTSGAQTVFLSAGALLAAAMMF